MGWGTWLRGPADRAVTRAAWDKWHLSAPPSWRSSVGGFSPAGEFVALVQNDDLTGAWPHLDERLVANSDLQTYELLPERIGLTSTFVQFITGRSTDVDRMLAVLAGMQNQMPKHRPDVVRADLALTDKGFFVQTVFFTSEAQARAAQDQEFSGGFQALFEEAMRLVEHLEFIDVPEPWISWATPTTTEERLSRGDKRS